MSAVGQYAVALIALAALFTVAGHLGAIADELALLRQAAEEHRERRRLDGVRAAFDRDQSRRR